MRTCTVSTLVVALLLAGRASAQTLELQQKIEKSLELKKLQGVWVPKLLVSSRGVEEYPLKGRVLLFQKNDFVRMEGARPVMLGTFGIEPSAEAWHLDLMVTARDPRDGLAAGLLAAADRWPDAGVVSVRAVGDALSPATIAAAVWDGRRYAEQLDTPDDRDVPFLREVVRLA